MFGNAVMVYELADFVIRYIQSFSLSGMSDIEELHAEANRRVATLRNDQEALKRTVSAPRNPDGSWDYRT